MGPIVYPETSVRNYHYSLPNNPKEGSSRLNSGLLLTKIQINYSLCIRKVLRRLNDKLTLTQRTIVVRTRLSQWIHGSVKTNLGQKGCHNVKI
jgi:hypothetical protein